MSACSGVSAGDNAIAVVKEYVAALNAGDLDTALSLVAEPIGATAENILLLEGTSIPEPLAKDSVEEIGNDVEAINLAFDVGGMTQSFPMQKVQGQWKLKHPNFIGENRYGSEATRLKGMGAEFTLADGRDPFAFAFVVHFDKATVPVAVNVNSPWLEPFEMKGTEFNVTADQAGFYFTDETYPLNISDAMQQKLADEFSGEVWSNGNSTSEVLQFPAKTECSVTAGIDLLADTGENATIECSGGLLRATAKDTQKTAEGPMDHITVYVNLSSGSLDARGAYSDALAFEVLGY